MPSPAPRRPDWPELPLAAWRDTYATLHTWTQMVGKTLLALAPPQNHWWHVTFQVSARGLATGPMVSGPHVFDAAFDFVEHVLVLRRSDGASERIPLKPCSVADFWKFYRSALATLGIEAHIWPVPCELPSPIRFTDDREHAAYDPEYAHRHWRILVTVDQVFKRFRGRFLGKSSPVHFFWGGFDLATTRFSGRRASGPPRTDAMNREAYSHEVISAGFWPGSGTVNEAAFYAYAAPAPAGYTASAIQPAAARYEAPMGLFILPYDTVRTARDPTEMLLAFLQSTYDVGADLGRWDRASLERPQSEWDVRALGHL